MLAERIFEVVDQFNRCIGLVTDTKERTTLSGADDVGPAVERRQVFVGGTQQLSQAARRRKQKNYSITDHGVGFDRPI
jgi:hypothetical protein